MENKNAINLVIRYVILIILGLFNLKIFYAVFTPLTVYPAYWLISLMYNNAAMLPGNVIFFGGLYAEIISACVAGAAYYLLLILNLTTPMKALQRTKSIVFLFLSFLVLNILRIIVFANIALAGGNYFDIAHQIMWYFGSTIMVVVLWFLNIWLFKIKSVPIYTDMKNLYHEAVSRK